MSMCTSVSSSRPEPCDTTSTTHTIIQSHTTTTTTTTTQSHTTTQSFSLNSPHSSPLVNQKTDYFLHSLLFFACFLGSVVVIYLLVKLYLYISRKRVISTGQAEQIRTESAPMVPAASSNAPAHSFVVSEVRPSHSRATNVTFELKPSHTKSSNLTFELV